MMTIAPVRSLKFALYLDAAGSLALAALQLGLTERLSVMLSLPAPLLTETGYFMLAYGLVLVFLGSARRLWAAAVRFIVIGNVGWALGCMAATAIVSPTGSALAFLVCHAVAVLMFAWLQRAGLRASLPPAQDGHKATDVMA